MDIGSYPGIAGLAAGWGQAQPFPHEAQTMETIAVSQWSEWLVVVRGVQDADGTW